MKPSLNVVKPIVSKQSTWLERPTHHPKREEGTNNSLRRLCLMEYMLEKTFKPNILFYRPHENDEPSLEELDSSLSRLPEGAHTIIGGDFNLPGWDWNQTALEPCRSSRLHQKIIDILN